MGLVDDILVTESPLKYNISQNPNLHPLRDINGTKSLMATTVAFHKSSSHSIIRPISYKPERTGLAPFGLYPQAGLLNCRRSVDSLEPIRTSLRTYRGILNKGRRLTRLYAFPYRYITARLSKDKHKEYKLGREKFTR
jgi:hypothetical protein